MTQGVWFAGYRQMLLDGKPAFAYSRSHYHEQKSTIAAKDKNSEGNHTLVLHFAYDGGGLGKGGTATLLVDGKEVAKGRIEETVSTRCSINEGLEIGRGTGSNASDD